MRSGSIQLRRELKKMGYSRKVSEEIVGWYQSHTLSAQAKNGPGLSKTKKRKLGDMQKKFPVAQP